MMTGYDVYAGIWAAVAATWAWLHHYGLIIPIVQLSLASLLGFIFAEQWQRWRQLRDFRYRTLTKFNEITYDLMDRMSELLVRRGHIPPAQYIEKRREFVSRWTVLAAMRPEVMACYGRALVRGRHYQGMFTALNTLRGFINAPEPILQARFEPEQEKFLAYREAVVADMVNAMRLLSRQDHDAERRESEQRLEQANAAAARD
jgi:hypothetical protein